MKTTLPCAVASLVLSSCVVVNNQKLDATATQGATAVPQVRGALSGQRLLLVSFYANAADCTSMGFPTLKVAKPPQHGQVSVEHGTAVAAFSKTDARSICNGQSVPATVIYYTSDAGFTGRDSMAFDRIGVTGAYGYHAYVIEVR